MKCSVCGNKGLVIDTSPAENNTIYRRRKCPNCGRRWTTYEIDAEELRTLRQDLKGAMYRLSLKREARGIPESELVLLRAIRAFYRESDKGEAGD
jgi:transcriptional regulator NrdR family protein